MIARFLTRVKVQTGPSTSTEAVATYEEGEIINYDKTEENEGRLWISYIGSSENRRYCCARDTNGEIYIDLGNSGGNVSLNQKSSCILQ